MNTKIDDKMLTDVVENTDAEVLELSNWDVFRKITKLAIPMGLSFTFSFEVVLAVVLLNAMSRNNDDIAAAALVSILMNTVCVLGVSPLFSVALLLSNKLGDWREASKSENAITLEQKKAVISSFNANTLVIASAISPIAFLALFFSKDILVSIFHQDANVANIAQDFLRTYSFAIPGILTRAAFEQIMFGFGKTKPAMWIGLGNLAIGSLIAGVLGFGLISSPKLGPQGVAIGFLLEAYLTAACYGAYVALSPTCKEFNFFNSMLKKIRENKGQRQDILNLGGSISFTVAIELAMTLSIGIFSGLVGTAEQSAMSFNMQFIYFEFVMLAAFSFSCAQEISRELGAKKYANANKIAKYGLLTTVGYLTPLPVIFSIYPKALLISGASNDVLSVLIHLTPIMSCGVIADAVRYNLLQQLRAVGDLTVPNVIAVFGMCTGIALSAALGLKTSLGIDGVAAGYTIGIGLTATGLAFRWKDQVKTSRIGRVDYAQEIKSYALNPCLLFKRSGSRDTLLLGNQSLSTRLIEEKDSTQSLVV